MKKQTTTNYSKGNLTGRIRQTGQMVEFSFEADTGPYKELFDRIELIYGEPTRKAMFSKVLFPIQGGTYGRPHYQKQWVSDKDLPAFEAILKAAIFDLEGAAMYPSTEDVKQLIESEWYKMPVSFRNVMRLLLPEIETQEHIGDYGLKAILFNKRGKDVWEVGRLQNEHGFEELDIAPELLERLKRKPLSTDAATLYAAILIGTYAAAMGRPNGYVKMAGFNNPTTSTIGLIAHVPSLCYAAGFVTEGWNAPRQEHYRRLLTALEELRHVWVAPRKGSSSVLLISDVDVKELEARIDKAPETLHQSIHLAFNMSAKLFEVEDDRKGRKDKKGTKRPYDLFNLQGLQPTAMASTRAARAANDVKRLLSMQLHREFNEHLKQPELTFTLERLCEFTDLMDVYDRQRKPERCREHIEAALDALKAEGLLTYRIEVANKAKKQPLRFHIALKTGPDLPTEYAPENPPENNA